MYLCLHFRPCHHPCWRLCRDKAAGLPSFPRRRLGFMHQLLGQYTFTASETSTCHLCCRMAADWCSQSRHWARQWYYYGTRLMLPGSQDENRYMCSPMFWVSSITLLGHDRMRRLWYYRSLQNYYVGTSDMACRNSVGTQANKFHVVETVLLRGWVS